MDDLLRALGLNAPRSEAADVAFATLTATLVGIGIGHLLAEGQRASQAPYEGNPYRSTSKREIVTVEDLERWVWEHRSQLPEADRILRDLAQLPADAKVTQQLIRDVLPPAR